MPRLFILLLAACIVYAQQNTKGATRILEKKIGKYSKHGWNHYGPGHFILDRTTGVLESNGGMGLFWYSGKKYKNFILELDYKTSEPKANSGIFLRVPDIPVSDDYIIIHLRFRSMILVKENIKLQQYMMHRKLQKMHLNHLVNGIIIKLLFRIVLFKWNLMVNKLMIGSQDQAVK